MYLSPPWSPQPDHEHFKEKPGRIRVNHSFGRAFVDRDDFIVTLWNHAGGSNEYRHIRSVLGDSRRGCHSGRHGCSSPSRARHQGGARASGRQPCLRHHRAIDSPLWTQSDALRTQLVPRDCRTTDGPRREDAPTAQLAPRYRLRPTARRGSGRRKRKPRLRFSSASGHRSRSADRLLRCPLPSGRRRHRRRRREARRPARIRARVARMAHPAGRHHHRLGARRSRRRGSARSRISGSGASTCALSRRRSDRRTGRCSLMSTRRADPATEPRRVASVTAARAAIGAVCRPDAKCLRPVERAPAQHRAASAWCAVGPAQPDRPRPRLDGSERGNGHIGTLAPTTRLRAGRRP
ncbi:hypothetical protein SAMN05421835_123121 [Amycolatopsis sacchari]|uniref:Uncharacterized protein n=1 Tax=Amycolatopsis sacchari TaxID=115433 RepID=A0A1I4ACM2_9PSEU|nr:hypothetical protein SAMN05421835_123121 [Amycolatopsis sacchari]